MKFATATLFLSLLSTASAFAPPAASITRAHTTTQVTPEVRPSTELNLFGTRWRKSSKKINSRAKVDGEITPKEVRALFELWNAALATGDSRIVASRYSKVCLCFYFELQ